MKRFAFIGGCTLLAGVLVWMGLAVARADMASTAPATSQASATTQKSVSAATQTASSMPAPLILPPASPSVRAVLMPRIYSVLLTRSMFVRGHMADPGHEGGQRAAEPPPAPSLDRAETALLFNGVTQTANSIDALVEDTQSGRVITVHPGDAIAKGKVGKITFDTLEYIKGGRTSEIHIGQDLTGGSVDTSTIVTTTQPAGSGASPEDILERLRQKRLQQLGGGK